MSQDESFKENTSALLHAITASVDNLNETLVSELFFSFSFLLLFFNFTILYWFSHISK